MNEFLHTTCQEYYLFKVRRLHYILFYTTQLILERRKRTKALDSGSKTKGIGEVMKQGKRIYRICGS